MLGLIVLTLTSLANILLGLIALIKNPKGLTNRLFLLLTVSFVIWSIINFLSVNPALFSQLTLVRLVLFCGGILNLTVFLTILAFPDYSFRKNYRKRIKAALVATAIILPLTLSPLVFKDIKIINDSAQPIVSPGIVLFLLHTVILLGSSFIILLKKYLSSTGENKNQLRLVLFAIVGTLSLIITTNFLLVVIFSNTAFVPFGPSFTLIFSAAMAYAIVRHKLFNIKKAIARSVVYVLSLGFLALVYILIIQLASAYIFNEKYNLDNTRRVFYVSLALISGLMYGPLRRFFDHLTKKVFYKNAYNPQEFLDQLNSSIVGTIEIGILLRHSTSIIQQNLRSEHCFIQILAKSNAPERTVGSGDLELSKAENLLIENRFLRSGAKLLLADQLDYEDHLKKLFDKHDIAIIANLNSGGFQEGSIARIIIGAKKDGSTYVKEDLQIIKIIADELVIAIQNALRFEEIQQFNLTLQEKVNKATEKLQATNKKLLELDEAKDEFISMASHQLRTPLTSVKGYMSMVMEGDGGKLNKKQKDLLAQAFASSQRMVYLVADLLNVSRLKAGKFILDSQPTNLAEVVSSEIEQLKQTARTKNLQLDFIKPKAFPDLLLDETKIRQVIMNFADNAIYYTPKGGKIVIELKQDKRNIYFTVKDNGLGVPKTEKAKLFVKFYRATNAKKARPDGTGLGLFMAKKVIDTQGGNLIFESAQNKGSTFGFTFNKKKLAIKNK